MTNTIPLFLTAAAFAASCLVVPGDARAHVTVRVPPRRAVVRVAPPPQPVAVVRVAPPVAVARAVLPPPGPGQVWVGPYYRWTGSAYVLVPGRWVLPPRTGAVWVAPRWHYVPARRGYVFVAGVWR